MEMKRWGLASAAGGETAEMSLWEIQVLIAGARGEMDEIPAMSVIIVVEAEETANLLAGSEATTKAKMSTLTGQVLEGTSTSI